MYPHNLPVAIIGAGPVGMAAAAHLVKRGMEFILLEAGRSVGANIRSWGHVRVFSPWEYNLDQASRELLEQTSWRTPKLDDLPTGDEIVAQYLTPLAMHPSIEPHLHLNTRVLSIGRLGMDKVKTHGREKVPFQLRVESEGKISQLKAGAMIDATGTWAQANPIGAGGIPAIGEESLKSSIFYGIPDVSGKDSSRYAGKKVLVVGGGHSAIQALLSLAELQASAPETQIVWILRKRNLETIYGGKEQDALKGRGELGIRMEALVNSGRLQIFTPFHIEALRQSNEGIEVSGNWNGHAHAIKGIEEIIANTGSRPDLDMLREVRVNVDAHLESVHALADLIDPNLHSCGTVRPHGEAELRHAEPNLYIVGAKSYGRAPTFLMATGYEQVRSVVAHLAGDFKAAKQVRLSLPETGVCSSNLGFSKISASCCGPSTDSEPACDSEPEYQEITTVSCCAPTPVAQTKPKLTDGCCG
ncbi:FAD-dependent oxidoreductase [Pontibacter sp. G13]|uniref:FAD-dependent oxidoreductase n=1 Tax=Pontibacter sp. G13 TaxID=3074898 RepID=UPI002889587B|nr:FAD-dependent oxidoreductase [Pontibacter sp. G13]WNJ17474.1 FAD-dependent oxidoreductase [Pontibacter sp. G13]